MNPATIINKRYDWNRQPSHEHATVGAARRKLA
jgi:hypothetical protein